MPWSFALSLFSSRDRQITDEWMQCIMNFAYLHHVHGTISIYAFQRVSQSLGRTGHDFYIVCGKWLVGRGVTWQQSPQGGGEPSSLPGGWTWGGKG